VAREREREHYDGKTFSVQRKKSKERKLDQES
jgi:hypothetical protein